MSSRNRHEVQNEKVDQMLNNMKVEIASELGIPNYDKIDKGTLPSGVNGKVGGTLLRRIVRTFEQNMERYPELADAITHPDSEEFEETVHDKEALHTKYGKIIDTAESEITQ